MNEVFLSDSNEIFSELSKKFAVSNTIDPAKYDKYAIKKGLRNADNTGVMVGLTKICNVEGYYISDSERLPRHGRLIYRGIDLYDFVNGCIADDRFGFEELVWLLIFGTLPTKDELEGFCALLAENRELPFDFIEDVIMRAPSPNIMNKIGSSITALYAYDENPDDISIENVLRQSLQLIARLPSIMAYAYQVKRRYFYKKSMYIHPIKPEQRTAEVILNSIRSDKKFTDKEAKLLDICLMIHADHGGGNNSTFTTRCVTSSGTDTYSAIGAGVGSLKGFRHGGANIKVSEMVNNITQNISDITDEAQVRDYLHKIVKKQANDGSGLIYGMGHAIYTLSDPRAVLLKQNARELAEEKGLIDQWTLLDIIERTAPEVFAEEKGYVKTMCANVDLYSGLVYKALGIPEDLFTPMFAIARVAGWCAHRLEEIATCSKIMRPAYKNLSHSLEYKNLSDR
ncbi:MAG: citrate synthase [Clostridia bacterium]|nr:citrate synthase [Clostridia bacterium]MBR3974483.1 citrate synthase [Clostridia bacterium]